ncbi:hypothetical protein HHK36_002054 [Tetracentron sinense]|uniref:Uncharacterized protein n=1 Tax=Tetracentron sinense TaxID=13715 RepID=A0A834ZYK1_TETSI|nr:hypothetical protein HHK36_002054 [Tetracentron sinense]
MLEKIGLPEKPSMKGGGLKLTPKYEDEILSQILDTDGKDPLLSGQESDTDMVFNLQRPTSGVSCSNFRRRAVTQDVERDILKSPSVGVHNHAPSKIRSASPEELRQQALEEKKKYKILKGEGKPEEALRAFKRGKELERQAGEIELALRKDRRKALSSSKMADIQKQKMTLKNPAEKFPLTFFRKCLRSCTEIINIDIRGRGLKLTPKYEDEILSQILDTDGKDPLLSGQESDTDMVFNLQRPTSGVSCSNFHEEAVTQDVERDILKSPSVGVHNHAPSKIRSASPEELRQQALEEKKNYKILKGEGKSEEALRAFKRGKELERQAGALEISLRKNRKRALSSSNMAYTQRTKDDPKESSIKGKISPQMGKEEKDDLSTELRELGWSDADLHDADKKPANLSLEGELSSLLGEIPRKSNPGKGTGGIGKSQVLAHKKKALMFKREGKLTEAKEELKRAKVLEKQLEEEEFLAEAEDSDDELSSLIRSMDDEKQHNFSIGKGQDPGFEFDHLVGVTDDLGLDGHFEVTDEDMDDPDIAAALKSIGWGEDSDHPEDVVPQSVPMDKEALLNEILSLKREALNQKRAGNVVEAMAQLKKAKLLERDFESLQSQGNSSNALNPTVQKSSPSQIAEKSLKSIILDDGTVGPLNDEDPKLASKSKSTIQKELLGLKRKALALKREGRLDEAEEELKRGKVLECQLEKMENASKVRATQVNVGSKDSELAYEHPDIYETLALGNEGDVTDQDMHDPALLSLLKNIGWKDEDIEPVSLPSRPSQSDNFSENITNSVIQAPSKIPIVTSKKSKSEIQRELLSLKRKALALRRQGEAEEAEEVLRMAKELEAQMAELEVPKKEVLVDFTKDNETDGRSLIFQEMQENMLSIQENETIKPPLRSSGEEGVATEKDEDDPVLLSVLKNLGWKDEDIEPVSMPTKHFKRTVNHSVRASDPSEFQGSSDVPIVAPRRSKAEIQKELLGLKRKALVFRRRGETEEAEEVLRMAKVLEAQMEEMEAPKDLLLNSAKNEERDHLESLISHVKHGNIIAVEEASRVAKSKVVQKDEVTESLVGMGWKESNQAKHPRNSTVPIPETPLPVEGKIPLIAELGPPGDKRTADDASFFPQLGQPVYTMGLLTGDGWRSSQLPFEGIEDEGNFSTNIPSSGNPPIHQETYESPDKEIGMKAEIAFAKRDNKTVLVIDKLPILEANSGQGSDSYNNHSSPQQEILARKRMAIALKREGKLTEAREELRQAKLLEKNLKEDNPQLDASPTDVSFSISNDTLVGQKEHRTTNQAPRPMSGRDRFKLQQESLAHKRKALKLRREGRMEEAEAEFELAKALETQLEELAGPDLLNSNKSVNEKEQMNGVGVEDLLDPQLLSALKAIGLQDTDIVLLPPERSEAAKPNIGKSENINQERSQLEEQIKAEKVEALNLKRAGNQAEALNVLRRAKQLEKKLNSLSS